MSLSEAKLWIFSLRECGLISHGKQSHAENVAPGTLKFMWVPEDLLKLELWLNEAGAEPRMLHCKKLLGDDAL